MSGVQTFTILENVQVAKDHYELIMPQKEDFARVEPGQFVNILCRDGDVYDPLLRRPFSLFSSGSETWSFLFRVVGRGTLLLSRLQAGATIDVLGPLGRGFHTDHLNRDTTVLLVGGGVGTPPLFFLSERLRTRDIPHHVLLGFATRENVIAVDRWEAFGMKPVLTTDDGSAGRKGMVTEPLEEMLKKGGVTEVFSCGPRPMLRAVASLCQKYDVACQVAMEEWMGCGVGVCLSCVCPVIDDEKGTFRLQRVCVEGPVFDGARVVWTL